MVEAGLLEKPLPALGVPPLRLLYAAAVIVAGYVVVKLVRRSVEAAMRRAGAPEIAVGAASGLVSVLAWIAVILAAASALGLSTGSVVLGVSAIIGLVFGFGLQDTVANLAAGIWLAVYRPFDIGDVVEIAGKTGVVKALRVMGVELATFDNTYVFIPSKNVWGGVVTNYTRYEKRRVEVNVGVAYGTDLDKAVKVLLDAAKETGLVLPEPEPQVVVTELADSSINLSLRAWVRREDYGRAKSLLTRRAYEALTAAGIEIPFPQLDVHIRDMPKPAT